MTPEQRRAILQMAVVPGAQPGLDRQAFIEVTGIETPESWALDELRKAIDDEAPDNVELAMQVGAQLGMDRRWVEPLIEVLDVDWTHSHEDAAYALGDLGDPTAVPALVRAAMRIPQYLEYDEGRSLAVKAIHSLGKIPGPEAALGLDDLRNHEDAPLRASVERVIKRRSAG